MLMGHGQCPKCDKPVEHMEMGAITIGDKFRGPLHHGISYVCPHCKAILGAAIDPIGLANDTVRQVLEALGARPKKR